MILTLFLLLFQIAPEIKQHVEAGLAAKESGDLDGAAREFQRVTELAPNLPAAFVNLGAVYYAKRDFARAIPPLEQALKLNPDLPGVHAMLGISLLAQGYATVSIPHLEKGQQMDTLGVALLEAARPREAIDKLEAALEKRRDDPDLLYYLGQAYNRLSKQALELILQRQPDSPRAHQILGEANVETGNREAAQTHFKAALAGRPDLQGVHYALGEIALAAGDYSTAEQQFRQEAGRFPGSAATAYKLGLVLLNRGDTKQAFATLQHSDQLQPDMPQTLLELGKAETALGEHASAEKHFRRILAHEPTSNLAAAAHLQLAQLYRASGRLPEADRELKEFQALRNKTEPRP